MVVTHYGNQQYYGLSSDTKPLAADTAINATFGELDTGDQYINNGTAWVLQVGAGGGLSAGGQISFNGTAVQTVFNIPHGLSQTPDFISVQPASADAFGSFTRTKDATNIIITYSIPPPTGTSNVTFQWGAGFVSEDIAIGLSSSSTTTFTNKEIDIDTNKLRNFHQASWIIYRPSAGGTIKAYNVRTGVVDYSHATDLNTVLQSVLDASGYSTIYISDHLTGGVTYPINVTGFTGFQLGYRQHIVMGKNTKIQVPNGYTGVVFKLFNSDAKTCYWNKIEGGWILETGTPARNWTAFQIYSTKAVSGGDFNEIIGTRIDDCGVAVQLKLDNIAATWINGNTVRDLIVFYPKVALDFVNAGTANSGINRNLFQNIIMQGAAHTTHGAKNVRDNANLFIDCKFWDIHLGGATARTATIAAEADGMIVVGGIMGYQGDNGIEDLSNTQNTTIIDQWNIVRHKGAYSLPSLRKVGAFHGTSPTSGDGVFASGFSAATGHTASQITSSTDGKCTRYTTALTAGSVAGIRFPAAVGMRPWNPRFKCRFRVNSAWGADSRLFLGLWTQYGSDPANSDTLLNTQNGIMLYTRPADTSFTAGRNNASATGTFSTSNLGTIDTGIHTFEVIADERNARWFWRFDSNALTTVASGGPLSTAALGVTAMIQTTSTTPKTLDIFYLETEGDK